MVHAFNSVFLSVPTSHPISKSEKDPKHGGKIKVHLLIFKLEINFSEQQTLLPQSFCSVFLSHLWKHSKWCSHINFSPERLNPFSILFEMLRPMIVPLLSTKLGIFDVRQWILEDAGKPSGSSMAALHVFFLNLIWICININERKEKQWSLVERHTK